MIIRRMLGYITIQHFISSTIHPTIRVLIILHHHSSYPLRSNISFSVLHTFLQKENSYRTILPCHLTFLAEACQPDTIFLTRHLYLIIITDSFGTLGKRNSPIHILLSILGSCYRLQHITQINGSGCQYSNIHHSQYLDALYMRFQTSTISIVPFVPVNRIICFNNAHYLSHHIRGSPRRPSHILIRFVTIYFLCRAYLIKKFGIAAYNTGLMNLTDYPLIHISVFYRYHLFLGKAIQRCYSQKSSDPSKTTSVVTVSIKNTNKKRGEDFINKLVEIYNKNANNDKNEVAQNTARFIDERISVINQELGTTEQELESFKREAGLTDLSSDAQLAVSEQSAYEKLCVENGTQLNLVQYLSEYIQKPENAATTLPANVGLNDETLSGLITQYNALILERNRLLRTSSETNPVVRRLDSNIQDMRAGILTTIASVRKGLLITKADLDRQAGKYAGRISNAPAQERRFVSIQRQQEIKAGLYLMLLQKREENNIALAATANNAKIIDDALADDFPVSPQSKKIYMMAFVLGLGIPVAIIYILNLLSYRIEGRADVERLTNVSIIGDVPLNDSEDKHAIAVRENDNDIMAETFRSLRTNLLFMLGDPDRKVILVTSTMSGEGKTFIASNLAVSLALLGKKVIIVGLDIRKPGLNKVFRIHHKEKGITGFLSAPQSTDLRSMILPSEVSDNLHVLPGGAIPPNPTELLARKSLDDAIELLKKDYDYVVLDTAPIGMVTDTQLIARVADISVYVCRADYTHKNDYQLINELYANKRLPGLCTVINGLDMKKKKYGYYYGYGKYGRYYGYGKKYGYGYGYGYGDTSDSK